MVDIHEAETLPICPITSTHGATPQGRWEEPHMAGYHCTRCGEFSIAKAPMLALRLGQYSEMERERISQVLAAIWNNGQGVAPRLDDDGLARVIATPFASTKDDPVERPLAASIEQLTAFFRTKRSGG